MSQVNNMAVSALTQKAIKEGTTPEAQEGCQDTAWLWKPGLSYCCSYTVSDLYGQPSIRTVTDRQSSIPGLQEKLGFQLAVYRRWVRLSDFTNSHLFLTEAAGCQIGLEKTWLIALLWTTSSDAFIDSITSQLLTFTFLKTQVKQGKKFTPWISIERLEVKE